MRIKIRRAVRAALLKKWGIVPNLPIVTEYHVILAPEIYGRLVREVDRITNSLLMTEEEIEDNYGIKP